MSPYSQFMVIWSCRAVHRFNPVFMNCLITTCLWIQLVSKHQHSYLLNFHMLMTPFPLLYISRKAEATVPLSLRKQDPINLKKQSLDSRSCWRPASYNLLVDVAPHNSYQRIFTTLPCLFPFQMPDLWLTVHFCPLSTLCIGRTANFDFWSGELI